MFESDAPLIDVIVVSYGHAHFMDNLFASLAKVAYPRGRWRLHVVVNKDGDGTAEEVRRLTVNHEADLPPVTLHEPHANLGFSGGNNLAMVWAMQHAADFVYLLNPDTAVEPDFLEQAIKVAQTEKNVGSVQSLLVRGDDPSEMNSRGNALHFLGFGYCLGDHQPLAEAPDEVTDVGYASGAGVLLPVKILQEVGLLDETFFAYHEDLDLGWRIMLAGYRNVLAPQSRVRHYYEFSRSIAKWYWMERNRLLVMLKNYSFLSLLVLSPSILATEVAIWAFAVKGGWLKEKWKASIWLAKPSTWRYLMGGRQQISRIRRVSDWLVLRRMTWKIEYQEMRSGWAEKIANPFWHALYISVKIIVRW